MKNSKTSNKSFNSLKEFIIFANEEGYTELNITDFDIKVYSINLEIWLSKEKGWKKDSDSYKRFLKEDILFEFLELSECIDKNFNLKNDSSIDFIVTLLKKAKTGKELESIINSIRFGYRSNNINRFIKDNNLDGLFRNMISRYYNLKQIHKNGESFLSNFFDWFYNDIIPVAEINSKHSGSDGSQNLRIIGKFELKLAEKLKSEYPQYSVDPLHCTEDSNLNYAIKLIWNGQKNQLYDVFRQLKTEHNNKGQTMIGNSYTEIAQFIVSNIEGFSNNQFRTILDELERNDRPKKSPIDIIF